MSPLDFQNIAVLTVPVCLLDYRHLIRYIWLTVPPSVILTVLVERDIGMNAKLAGKIILQYVLIPFIIISIAMLIFGKEPVHKFLIYATPVLLLPLLLKLLKKYMDRKKSDTPP